MEEDNRGLIDKIIDEMCRTNEHVIIKVKTDEFSSKKIVFYGNTAPDILSEVKEMTEMKHYL
jgi:UDP-N-acetylglucosamine 2-epimerase